MHAGAGHAAPSPDDHGQSPILPVSEPGDYGVFLTLLQHDLHCSHSRNEWAAEHIWISCSVDSLHQHVVDERKSIGQRLAYAR